MKIVDNSCAEMLYERLKTFLLSQSENFTYSYQKKNHNLYEEQASEKIREQFYNERGYVEISLENGEIMRIEISRVHAHQHSGWSGLNSIPQLHARIYVKGNCENPIWELIVESRTLYYKALATSIELPPFIKTGKSVETIESKNFSLEPYFKLEDASKKKYQCDSIEFKKEEQADILNHNNSIQMVLKKKL